MLKFSKKKVYMLFFSVLSVFGYKIIQYVIRGRFSTQEGKVVQAFLVCVKVKIRAWI